MTSTASDSLTNSKLPSFSSLELLESEATKFLSASMVFNGSVKRGSSSSSSEASELVSSESTSSTRPGSTESGWSRAAARISSKEEPKNKNILMSQSIRQKRELPRLLKHLRIFFWKSCVSCQSKSLSNCDLLRFFYWGLPLSLSPFKNSLLTIKNAPGIVADDASAMPSTPSTKLWCSSHISYHYFFNRECQTNFQKELFRIFEWKSWPDSI